MPALIVKCHFRDAETVKKLSAIIKIQRHIKCCGFQM